MENKDWHLIYLNFAEILSRFYEKYKDKSGHILYESCRIRDKNFKVIPWIKNFEGFKVTSIDPIHIFASFNYWKIPTDIRKERMIFFIKLIREHNIPIDNILLDIDSTPLDLFKLFPHVNITHLVSARDNKIQNEVWEFFYLIQNKNINSRLINLFDTINNSWYGIRLESATIFMFWVNSNYYVPLDTNTFALLKENKLLNKMIKTYDEYSKLLENNSLNLYRNLVQIAIDKNIMLRLSEKEKKGINNYFNLNEISFNEEINSPAMGRTVKIFDKNENPVLNIKSVARVFSKYIVNYNSQYTSTIIGIFAKWGRGKSFFYKLLQKNIKEHNNNIYFCTFQPWKYQKQESAWAYLYEKILNKYLETDKNYKKTYQNLFFNSKFVKIVKLNIKRIGTFDLIKNCVLLFIPLIGLFIPTTLKITITIDILIYLYSIGLIWVLFFIYKIYKFYLGNKDTIIKLVDKYGKTKDYSNYLGFQNEIEKELKYLINTFITKRDERLILFIDDLDRCNEKMIIDIMDSLRLVLEDEEINSKLTIITAIDERILLKSVKHKYFNQDDIHQKSDISPNEYIEKFFLIALKLNHLNDTDKEELIDEYSNILNDKSVSNVVPKIIQKIQNNEELDNFDKSFIKSEDEFTKYVKSKNIEVKDNFIRINGNKEISVFDDEDELEVLNINEVNFIKDHILKYNYNIDTPRKINMMIQRYLLFKNFIFEELGLDRLDFKLCISLMFYVLDKKNLEELIALYNNDLNETIEFTIHGQSFKEERKNYIVLIKYAEMVSPF